MNFKTPFKVLTTAALIGTLAVSTVAPGAASAATNTTVSAKAEVAQDIKSVVLKKGDDSITLSYNDYASAQGSKVLDGYVVTHVVADNGAVYDYETYGLAYSKGATTTEVFKKLADAEASTTEVPAEAKEASFNEDGELVVSTPTEEDFEVTEIAAISTKKIEVKFNAAAEVTAENFSVKKGTATSNISSVTIADDKKSAVIELSSKLTAGDYTVSVKNGEETVSETLTAEDEKVDKIELLSETAVLNDTDAKEATVGIQVLNQYGEDITKATEGDLTYTASNKVTATSDKGIVTLDNSANSADFKAGDKVTLTVVDPSTGASASKTISISDQAAVAEVAVGEIYNKDGKKLTTDSDLTKDDFYIPVTVKDQYGKEITSATKANDGLTITNQTSSVATFTDDGGSPAKIELQEVTIDDKDVLALKVDSALAAGTAKVLLIANGTGKNATATAEVGTGVTINSVSIGNPTKVVSAGAYAYFPVTVTDSEGNEVTTNKALAAIKDTLTVSGTTNIETPAEVEGEKGLFIKVPASDVVEGKAFTITATTQSGKVTTKTVTPKAEAVAKTIVGLNDKVKTAIREGGNITIANTQLVVEDQYNQKLDATQLADVKFVVESSAELSKQPFTLTNGSNADEDKKYTIEDASNTSAKDSDKLVFTLLNSNGDKITSSAFDKTFKIVKDADLVSYAVADVKPVYVTTADQGKTYTVPTTHKQDFVVEATSKSGDVVTLDESEYAVTGDVTATDVVSAVTNLTAADFKDGFATKTVTVTINATGDEVTKDVTFSTVAPKAEKVEYIVNELPTTTALLTADGSAKTLTANNITVTDQYGKKSIGSENDSLAKAATITFKTLEGKATFADNGKSTATVAVAAADAATTSVQATIKSGDKSTVVVLSFQQ